MSTILVVDDRPSNRDFLLTLLGYLGHRLLEAGDGAQALELIRSARPDLVITDILMPTMDGYEMVSRVRADPQLAATPVIFYTATYSEAQAMKLAASCGVDTVLPKPSDPDRILAAVNRALHPDQQAATIDAEPSAALEAIDSGRARSALDATLRDLQGVRAEFDAIAERGGAAPSEQDRVTNLSKEFSDNVSRLQRVTSRMSALIEVGFAMNLERNPERLVNLFFAAVVDVIDSRVAAVAMLDHEESAWRQVISRGVSADVFRRNDVYGGALGSLLTRPRTIRAGGADVEAQDAIPGHPPFDNVLAMSIASPDRIYGWILFADRIGADQFSQEDELLAGIMATELALRYEHTMLFDVVQRHAASLQIEVSERRRAQEALLESEGRFRQLAENIREVFWLTDASKNQMLYVSPAYEEIWGRSVIGVYGQPQDWIEAIHPDDRARVREAAHAKQTRGDYDEEYRIVRPDGSVRWIRDRAFPVREVDGTVVRVAGVAEDITERKREEQKLERLTRMYAVLSGINATIVRVADRGHLFQECCRIVVEEGRFALASVRLVDPLEQRMKPAATAAANHAGSGGSANGLASLDDRLEGRSPAALAVRERRAIVVNDVNAVSPIDQADVYLRQGIRSIAALPLMVGAELVGTLDLHSTEPEYFDQEEMRLLLELAGDISFALEHIRRAEKLEYLALFDSLTGLANRTLFLDRLGQRLHLAGQAGEQVAVVVSDIERLRTINDSLGRHAGDAVLKQLAERLARGAAREELARVGGDHFAIVLAAIKAEPDVGLRIERMWRDCTSEPFAVEGSDLRIATKAGIALYPKDGADAESLLRGAEAALRRGKETGERYVFHAPEMTSISSEKLSLENSLRRALEHDEFVLHYQTQLDLDTRRLVGAEALIRWQSPDQGLVLPGRFIGLLEETGLILDVGAWVLRRAVRDHRQCTGQGIALPRIAINVSSIQLRQRDFVAVVKEAISEEATPTRLDLEITESVLMEDVEGNKDKLKALRNLGVRITIDDFGTGYSSLSYLTKLPVDSLKIDRSFIAGMLSDPDTMTLVSTIVSLAHSLRLTVVAEGVETEEQASTMRLLRCDQAQGYLFSRPVPLEQLALVLRVNG